MKIEKVMIVDDDPGIRRVAEISLCRVGKWQVRVLDSGKKALEQVAEFRPDLILLDVMMPGMDGPTTFKLLRQDCDQANVPIIFLTAKVQKQEVQSYIRLGAAGTISKPFDPLTLPSEILSILNTSISAGRVA